ncbi:cupin domain-containing protein [Legionella anisa]|uniref:Cupin domain-containing protein n=1 Tax=Legionella anisa TaxID=28082 RepID=A0AAX0WQG7_9GAMM|nr:cupin domain-containing protein [Legionella anisa]AWN75555.1 cupin domain-containing protein [Legionella anisa]KTC76343.1 Cupin domain protein [Legionella anisa]MBN5935957.1 cupin domain-containing protein [Legionella anisa]MCW8424253.1 cupin domain-containing protein [Legionella anisa]MCW8446629.1 cupin domain-containing protein [Legionella anisa]
MPQLPESVVFASPRLVFSNPEHIVSGVVVNPVDFAQKQVAPPFQTTYFHVLPQSETPMDYHQEEEIWIVLNGSGVLIYEENVYRLNAHDIFYFASFKKHQIRNLMHEPLLICSIYW